MIDFNCLMANPVVGKSTVEIQSTPSGSRIKYTVCVADVNGNPVTYSEVVGDLYEF